MGNLRRAERGDDGEAERQALDRGSAADRAELRRLLVQAAAPTEYLQALDSGANLDEIVGNLTAAGFLLAPEDVLPDLLRQFRPLLRRGCDPFLAELSGAEFLATIRACADAKDVPNILATMIGEAEKSREPEALAMLRVFAVLAPERVRPLAARAADRLLGGGLKDPPWVRDLGTPAIGECFGYSDDAGAQTAIALTFGYGRRPHALAVLIDHQLGGGVKDCWPTDRPDQILTGYAAAAEQVGLPLRTYTAAEAKEALERALAAPTCPMEPDQIHDVGAYLDLLRQRVTLLGAGVGAVPATGAVYQLKIKLVGSKPPIWRRVEVLAGCPLQRLHSVIQLAFGWDDSHMWVFTTPFGDFGPGGRDLGHRGPATTRLVAVAPERGSKIRYTYDFGDDWGHEILVEDVLAPEPGVRYPRCLGGRRAAPPEDCGGIGAYLDLLASPSAAELDPAAFDLDSVNRSLSKIATAIVE